MLTPRFELSQTDDEVTIIIHAPYANIKDTVVHVDENDFRFYATPYYLRLNLPGDIEENDSSSGSYDCEKGEFTLKFSKVNKGEHFENLQMITSLLAPAKLRNIVPTIEVICNSSAEKDPVDNAGESKELKSNDGEEKSAEDCEGACASNTGDEWFTEQKLPSENPDIQIILPKYGFANKISGALGSFEDAWIKDIVDLPDPDRTSLEDRKKLQKQHELESFNEEHYLADLTEPESHEEFLHYKCEWETIESDAVAFTNEEKDILKELPNKQYLLTEEECKYTLFGLIDILYASCYNYRTTFGENTVESSWTINKLSSTLSWFQVFDNLQEVLISNVRRSLCYPLIRNWNLSMKVLEDVKKVVKLGSVYILKRLCEVHSLFNNSQEPRYILNQLYIKDYLIWLQQIPSDKITALDNLLENVKVEKNDIGLCIEELETAAYNVLYENVVIQNKMHELSEFMNDLQLEPESSVNSGPQELSHRIAVLNRVYQSLPINFSSSSSSSSTSSSDSDSSSSSDSTSSSDSENNQNGLNELDSDDEPN